MSVYQRYFKVTKGPLIAEVKRIKMVIESAQDQYREIIKEMGADDGYYQTGNKLVAVTFKGKEVNRDLFKRSDKGWYPKKTNAKSKEWWRKLDAVKTEKYSDALRVIGIEDTRFWMVRGGRVYFPDLVRIPKPLQVFVRMPWYDESPDAIEAFKKDPNSSDWSLDGLLWEPAAEMLEVKEWQFHKAIDDFNSKHGEQA